MKFRLLTVPLVLLPVALFAAISCAMPDMATNKEANTPESPPIVGKILEAMNSSGYTYLLLEVDGGFKDWVAIPELYVKVGDEVELIAGTQMGEFTSKPLKRTFKQIIFSPGPTEKYNDKRKADAHKMADMSKPLPGQKKSEGKVVEGLKVEKAKGENSFSIAELLEKRATLQDKTISVRGQVVKISTGIMGRNWVHIKDGTGENGENKLIVTTKDSPDIGEIVTCNGIFHNDVDFGGGYRYAVILEDASVKK